MQKIIKKSFFIVLFNMIFTCFSSYAASKYSYQITVPSVSNWDRASNIPVDKKAKKGFSYEFNEKLLYSPKYNTYVVGKHCYRGGHIRFDIPNERFVFYIDNKEYIPPSGGGGSVWHRFHEGAKLNFLLMWIDSAYSIVELHQDACAQVVLDTRYHVEDMLKQAKNKNVRVVVYDGSEKKIGEFTMIIDK